MKKETEDLLAKMMSDILAKEDKVETPKVSDDAVAELAKAVSKIGAKVDALSEIAVVEVPETTDDKIAKVADSVANLAKKIEEMAKAPVEPKAEEPKVEEDAELPKTQEDLAKMISDAVAKAVDELKPAETPAPKGEGKEEIAKINSEEPKKEELDISHVEDTNFEGEVLSKEQKTGRAGLDQYIADTLLGDMGAGLSEEEMAEIFEDEE